MSGGPIGAILGWLRAGYPDGVPSKDYHPLLALLTHTLGPQEVEEVVQQLVAERTERVISAEEVDAAIEEVKQAPPSEEDVRAVAARLAAVGWPLAGGSTRVLPGPPGHVDPVADDEALMRTGIRLIPLPPPPASHRRRCAPFRWSSSARSPA